MIAVSAPQRARPSARVVAVAHGHQQAADVGVAEAEGAEAVGELGDARARELRHQHGDLEGQRPEPGGVDVGVGVEAAVLAGR